MSFFKKQVRISPEIDWYHYQSANAAPTAIVLDPIKTHFDKVSHQSPLCVCWGGEGAGWEGEKNQLLSKRNY